MVFWSPELHPGTSHCASELVFAFMARLSRFLDLLLPAPRPPGRKRCARTAGPGTSPETGTIGTVFPETERSRNWNRRNRFSGTETRTRTVLFCWKTSLKHRKDISWEEPWEPKTGTARTVPCTNRKRTEPWPPWDNMKITIIIVIIIIISIIIMMLIAFPALRFRGPGTIVKTTKMPKMA